MLHRNPIRRDGSALRVVAKREGEAVNLIKTDSAVILELETDDREKIAEWREQRGWGSDDILEELLGPYLCNGWHIVPISCWDGLTISDDVEHNEAGEIMDVGDVYTFVNYALISEVDVLLKRGKVYLAKIE